MDIIASIWKRRYFFIIFVGIDIAKLDYSSPTNVSGAVVLIEPFNFTSDIDGFRLLSDKLDSILNQDNNIIVLESMAHYGNSLVRSLVGCSYNALRHRAGKLAGIFFKMLSDSIEFNLDYDVHSPQTVDFD